jgi:hypothetical protein
MAPGRHHQGLPVLGNLNGSRNVRPTYKHRTADPSRNGSLSAGDYKLSRNPNPNDDRTVFAVCGSVMTVRLSHLDLYRTFAKGCMVVPEISYEDYENILDGVFNAIPSLRSRVDHELAAVIKAESARHAAEVAKLKKEHAISIDLRALELLDIKTCPD